MAHRVLFVEPSFTDDARRYLEDNGCELVLRPFAEPPDEDAVIRAVGGFPAVIAGGEPYTARVIGTLRGLRIIARKGVGYDNVDVAAARNAGILVTNTPGATSRAVAEMTIALMLSLLRGLPRYDGDMKGGRGMPGPPARELQSSTVGIVGMGHIGREVIRLLQPFGPRFVAHDVAWDARFAADHHVERLSLEALMESSDFVSIHVPLGPQTRGLVGADLLGRMRNTAYLINTSRGPVVDKEALRAALEGGRIAGAGIDVHWSKPVPADDPIARLPNVIATPNVAFNTRECQARMIRAASEEVVAALQGRPVRYAVAPP